jgi:cytochrome c oxidase subunit 2
MKTFLKLAVIAAALGLAVGTVNAQPPAAVPPAAATSNAAAAAPAPAAPPATAPTAGIGQPADELSLQQTVTPIGAEASFFHNKILMPLIIVISGFVLFLLLLVMVRYRRGANPTPSRNTHNTTLEIVWTLLPVLILVAIAVPSIRLLAHQYDPPRADLTVKAIGNQWYWEYDYPDHGVHLVSNILPDAEAARRHEPRQLAADERMVVPVGAVVKVITTSNDVIHSFGVPALWVKMDAVPGRLNETWFRADREGVYYGVCYELCGARHGFMPIAVEVVSQARFAQWVAAKGGHMPGAHPAPATASAAAAAPAPTAAAAATPGTTNSSATR